jgi:2-methylcitrate dehydratase PrpD
VSRSLDLADRGSALAALASDLRLDDLPDDALRSARLALLDALGLASAGPVAPGLAAVLGILAADAPGPVPVPWTGLRLSAGDSALATSAVIHAWDFDDTHDAAVVHACSVAIPAALAVGWVEDAPGDRLLEAIVVGVEVACRLGRLLGPAVGVIRTGTCGVFGAAAAAGHVLGLDTARMNGALGTALALASSTRQVVVDGSLIKRLQPGFAARSGVLAARLATAGILGPTDWLDGQFGLAARRAPHLPDPADSWSAASPWEVTQLSLKPYPACRYTHGAILAAEELAERGWGAECTSRVVVDVPAGEEHALVARPWERRGDPLIDAQFSIPWLVAATLRAGRFDLTSLVPRALGDPATDSLARRVVVRQAHPQDPPGSLAPVRVRVEGSDGHTETTTVRALPGSPAAPRSWSDVLDKARTCLRVGGHRPELADELGAAVVDLPRRGTRQLLTTLIDSAEHEVS